MTLWTVAPARLFCPWNSPGKNTGVGCHVLLQGLLLAQWSNPHLLCLLHWQSFPSGSNSKESTCNVGDLGLIPGFVPWRKKQQPTPVFLPGESHGQRSLMEYSSWGCKESDRTEQLTLMLVTTSAAWEAPAIHIHVSFLPQTRYLSRLLHIIEQSSLCYTIGPCRLYILNIAVCTCWFSSSWSGLFPFS